MESIELRYTLVAEDLIEAERYQREYRADGVRKSFLRRWIAPAVCVAVAVLFAVMLVAPIEALQRVRAAPLLLGVGIVILVWAVSCRLRVATLIRRQLARAPVDSPLRQPQHVTVSSEAIVLSGPDGSTTYGWNEILGVMFCAERILFRVSPGLQTIAPRRATADATEWLQLQELVRRQAGKIIAQPLPD